MVIPQWIWHKLNYLNICAKIDFGSIYMCVCVCVCVCVKSSVANNYIIIILDRMIGSSGFI